MSETPTFPQPETEPTPEMTPVTSFSTEPLATTAETVPAAVSASPEQVARQINELATPEPSVTTPEGVAPAELIDTADKTERPGDLEFALYS